jgi:hypothetical protein
VGTFRNLCDATQRALSWGRDLEPHQESARSEERSPRSTPSSALRVDNRGISAPQVQSRLDTVNAVFSSGRATGLSSRSYTAKYLFSRLLKCGLCGSNIVLIFGRGGVGWAEYGCPLHERRGICSNALVLRRDALERELIDGLQRKVLREDLAAHALEEFKRQRRSRVQGARSRLAVIRNRGEKLNTSLLMWAYVASKTRRDLVVPRGSRALSETTLEQRRRSIARTPEEERWDRSPTRVEWQGQKSRTQEACACSHIREHLLRARAGNSLITATLVNSSK